MSIFGPEGGGNVIAEEYDSRHEHGLNVRAIGRYIVWYNEAEEKYIYYSVRSRKNVDIDTGRLIEIKNGNKIESGEETSLIHTRLDTSKELYVMLFNESVNISLADIGNNWSFVLSFNPFTDLGSNLIILSSKSRINKEQQKSSFSFHTDGTSNRIYFRYIDNPAHSHTSFYPINSKQLIHLSIGCESNTISLRVNGKPWRNYEFDYNHELTGVSILAPVEIGMLSIYNRRLSKSEFIQHFIDYHVPNFTNGEVLI